MDTGDMVGGTSGEHPVAGLDPADFQAPDFTRVRMREGYDIEEVDRFVSLLDAAVRQAPPGLAPDDVENLRFTPVRIRQGYDMAEVDEWLEHVTVHLRARLVDRRVRTGPLDLSVFDLPTFTVVRIREGYDMAQVQAFAEELRAKVRQDPPGITAEEVQDERFEPVQLRSGYDMGEVDDWLDRVIAELSR